METLDRSIIHRRPQRRRSAGAPVNHDAVAEMTIGLTIMAARSLSGVIQSVKDGHWPRTAGRELRGRLSASSVTDPAAEPWQSWVAGRSQERRSTSSRMNPGRQPPAPGRGQRRHHLPPGRSNDRGTRTRRRCGRPRCHRCSRGPGTDPCRSLIPHWWTSLKTYPRRKAQPQMVNGLGDPLRCPGRRRVESVNVGARCGDFLQDLLQSSLLDQRVDMPSGAHDQA